MIDPSGEALSRGRLAPRNFAADPDREQLVAKEFAMLEVILPAAFLASFLLYVTWEAAWASR